MKLDLWQRYTPPPLIQKVLYRAASSSFALDLRSQWSPGVVCSLRPFLLYQSKTNIWGNITLPRVWFQGKLPICYVIRKYYIWKIYTFWAFVYLYIFSWYALIVSKQSINYVKNIIHFWVNWHFWKKLKYGRILNEKKVLRSIRAEPCYNNSIKSKDSYRVDKICQKALIPIFNTSFSTEK